MTNQGNRTLQLNVPFKLFADCILTKGSKRSTINDLGRNNYFLIPNDLHEILVKYDGRTIYSIINKFGNKNKGIILEYFTFLLRNELIFFSLTPELFPKINFSKWIYPSIIYQAILDIGGETNIITSKIIDSLNNLNCKYLQLRIYRQIKFIDLKVILEKIESTSIVGIDIYLKFISTEEVKEIKKMANTFPRINNVIIYAASINKQICFEGEKYTANIALIKQPISNCSSCGVISPSYFAINIDSFTESLNRNSCLNQKISVDIQGNIKNCPSMKESFGNIKKITLEEALGKRGFKKYWNVTKDKIKGCKDCEFRHICTDCRAYLENPDDIYSKPLKCGYDPYTMKWEDWSKNPIKQKAINQYKLRETINS